jgi:putative peptidoglycan lipid II flippase
VVLGTLILGSIPLADQVISAQVGPGSVGAFFLGSKIVASITGISAIALSQAVIPRISQLATSGDRLALLALARNTIVIVVAVGLVASGLVSSFSAGIVDFVFARGRFGVAETAAVSAAQAAYAWHIAPFLAWIVISRILVTLGASRSVLWLSAMAALVNLALDLAVVDQFGVPGVALTTAITYGLVMGFGLFSLRRTIGAGD